MPEATTPTRKPPAPVLHARQAIALLRAEDAGQAALVEKTLPGYALSLARAGENVTVETLLAAAQMGPAHLKRQSHAPAPEDTLDAYHRIVANFDPYLGKTTQEKLVIACKKGDTGRVQDCIGQGADITANTNEAVRAAARAGHTEIVKFLLDQGADITADNNEALTSAGLSGGGPVPVHTTGAAISGALGYSRTPAFARFDPDDRLA